MSDFNDIFSELPMARWQQQLNQHSCADVERVLARFQDGQVARAQQLQVDELSVLLSSAAVGYLEELARISANLTRQRFGHTMRMFVPLYVSNLCANDCSYCGFSMSNAISRTTLDMQALERECHAIRALGFDAVLLVAGEHERKVGSNYFLQAIEVVRRYFTHVSLEVQPLTTEEYAELRKVGLSAVYVYQETYQREAYSKHHLRGKKSDIAWRLACPDRIGRAGIDKIGIGILLGLADWRKDALALAVHLRYLQRTYWRSRYTVSFPRLRPCAGGGVDHFPVTDAQLVQLVCAFRLFEPDLEFSLSTRESVFLRDHMIPLGITHMSAGSKTQPGGYADNSLALEQFSTEDQRSAEAVAKVIENKGLEVVWKDWASTFI